MTKAARFSPALVIALLVFLGQTRRSAPTDVGALFCDFFRFFTLFCVCDFLFKCAGVNNFR